MSDTVVLSPDALEHLRKVAEKLDDDLSEVLFVIEDLQGGVAYEDLDESDRVVLQDYAKYFNVILEAE